MKPSWDQLSAYVDGELAAQEAAAVAAAIAADSDLAAQVATLTRLKAKAAEAATAWDTAIPAQLPAAGWRILHRVRIWRPALAAASLALVIALAAAAFMMPSQDQQAGTLQVALDLHRSWISAPAATPRADNVAAAAALADIPDLTAAGLVLSHVAIPDVQAGRRPGVLFGFRGPRGCRVSLWVSDAPGDVTAVPTRQEFGGLVGFVWRVQHKGYVLLTRDMDPQRFATLASAVARITREQFRVDDFTRMALRQSADPAFPCLA